MSPQNNFLFYLRGDVKRWERGNAKIEVEQFCSGEVYDLTQTKLNFYPVTL